MGHKYLHKNVIVEFQLSRNHLEHPSNHSGHPKKNLAATQNNLTTPL